MFQIRMMEADRDMLDAAIGIGVSSWAQDVLLEVARREAKKKRPEVTRGVAGWPRGKAADL